ncbi:MAG: Ltp family lipoprotein [Atopobiaceae bacterium]|nr:Ltp family lipoprotein [Atopobiaceae bacterium]
MRAIRISTMAFASILALALCAGCGAQDAASQPEQQEAQASEATGYAAPSEAEGYEVLGGTWEVAAITHDDKVIPVDAVDGLANLYDNVFLGFSKDGTFEYRSNAIYVTRGTYAPYGDKDGVYLLKAETVSRATIDDGKITETEGEDSDRAFLVATDETVENMLGFAEIDLTTGKTKDGDKTTYFKKRGEKSVFDKDESDGGSSSSSSGPSSSGGSGNSSGSGSSSNSGNSSSKTYGSGNQRAVERAQQYLRTTSFSHDGLVEQLEYEGFSHEDAVYGADACGADWMEQAVLKAKQYLQTTAFSERGLVDQLVYEGFTQTEAEHGVSLCGANWMEQAVKKARQYQSFSSMSHSRLVEQLEYEGFTHEQAVYGADNA